MKCSSCVENPDWGGYYICLGCGKAICYVCQHKHCVDYLEEFNASYYDDPNNTDDGCHGATWYLCHECILNPPDKIRDLVKFEKDIRILEDELVITNKYLIRLMEDFKGYEGYTTSHRATRKQL